LQTRSPRWWIGDCIVYSDPILCSVICFFLCLSSFQVSLFHNRFWINEQENKILIFKKNSQRWRQQQKFWLFKSDLVCFQNKTLNKYIIPTYKAHITFISIEQKSYILHHFDCTCISLCILYSIRLIKSSMIREVSCSELTILKINDYGFTHFYKF
jgi:hypothetical protein